ncbi:MAG TPA: hypothetical protein VFE53_02955 [Mucilaginibacter sp.]|jgi:hypothetical protein|nr:hypothetical protein [Mucilaginibacter sp.]
MNWLHFFFWVAGIYALYYLVVILTDLTGGKNTAKSLSPELTFSETVQPVALKHTNADSAGNKTRIGEGAPEKKQQAEVIASGGVSLRDLFSLARQEAIIYTNAVGY